MISNYLKIATRNLLKHKLISAINIVGLAIGLASCLLIFQYVQYEYSHDAFWEDSENIYRIGYNRYSHGELKKESARCLTGVGRVLYEDLPEVEGYVQMLKDLVSLYTEDTQIQDVKMFATDSAFSSVFKLDYIYELPETPLKSVFSAVISESTAKKLFGAEDPMGKWFKVNEGWEFVVTGVFKDLPKNTHMPFDLLLSIHSYGYYFRNFDYEARAVRPDAPEPQIRSNEVTRWNWGRIGRYAYILTQPDAIPEDIEMKIEQISKNYTQHLTEIGDKATFYLQPLRDIHLNSNLEYEIKSNGNRTTVLALAAIAIIILVIAWINYVNLSLVRYLDRKNEAGVRKVLGAYRFQVIQQFFTESMATNILALVMALVAVLLTQNFFTFAGKPISFSITENPMLWVVFGAIFLLTSFVSALVPALIQSKLKSTELFKPSASTRGKGGLRQSLVVFQFAASIVLIVGTLMVYQQINYMKNQSLGVNINQMLTMYSPMTMIRHPQRIQKIDLFKSEITSMASVKSMSTSSAIPGKEIIWSSNDIRREGETQNTSHSYSFGNIDHDFIDNFELEILIGRNFSAEQGNESESVIINESAMKQLGFDSYNDAIDQVIYRGETPYNIIGIVNDHHHQSLRHGIKPIIFFYGYQWTHSVGYYAVKVSTDNIQNTIKSIEDVWETIYPGDHFIYSFLDESFDNQYKADQQFGELFSVFTLLALSIAGMGLLALTTYHIEQKTKEIGIRKALGSTVNEITFLLSKNIIQWVILANFIAWPVAWYVMNKWLEGFAYRINLNVWIFVLAGILVLGIAVITVGFQTSKAARANPVDALRNE